MSAGASFGQTYFIGVFGPAIQGEFGLSHTAWGSVYLLGTLGSALVLPYTGKQIDRLDLTVYALVVCGLLIFACVWTSLSAGVVSLTVAIFLLRQGGQGLMSHISITCMARYFESHRGRAIAISILGAASGEALLPFLAVIAIGLVGWRWSYAGVAILLALILVPSVLWLLRGHHERHRDYVAQLSAPASPEGGHRRSWTRYEVLRDLRFYLLLPGILAAPIIVTALFFHHLNLADAKGWSHAWITGNYVVYAIGITFVSLACGQLVDRLGAVRLVPPMLLPLVLGLVLIATVDHPWVVWPYLLLVAANSAIDMTSLSALWAEIYGVEHLGAIRKSGVVAAGVRFRAGASDDGVSDGSRLLDRTGLSGLRGLRGRGHHPDCDGAGASALKWVADRGVRFR